MDVVTLLRFNIKRALKKISYVKLENKPVKCNVLDFLASCALNGKSEFYRGARGIAKHYNDPRRFSSFSIQHLSKQALRQGYITVVIPTTHKLQTCVYTLHVLCVCTFGAGVFDVCLLSCLFVMYSVGSLVWPVWHILSDILLVA